MNVLKCFVFSILFINLQVNAFRNCIILKRTRFCRIMKIKVKKVSFSILEKKENIKKYSNIIVYKKRKLEKKLERDDLLQDNIKVSAIINTNEDIIDDFLDIMSLVVYINKDFIFIYKQIILQIINKQFYDMTDVKNRLPISEIIVRNIIIPTMVHDIVLTICRTFDSISNFLKHH